MRLGILSDTHNQQARTQLAVRMLVAQRADVLIHCGDITEPEIVALVTVLPSYFALGNHDADNVPRLRQAICQAGAVCLDWGGTVALAGKKVGVVHGHMTSDLRRVLAEGPDIVFSGHSHIARDWREGSTRRINPGSLFEADEFSVAVFDTETDEVEFLTVPAE